MYFARRHPNGMALGLGLMICLLCFAGLREVAHRVVPESDVIYLKDNPGIWPSLCDYTTAYGHTLRPNVSIPHTAFWGTTRVFDCVINTDALGLRRTPVDNPEARKQFLFFFGCSFTFGFGLNDDQTLPYYAGCFAHSFMPYNFACASYGPQQMLLKLREKEFFRAIPQPTGRAVYVFIEDQLLRAIGYHVWAQNDPCFGWRDGEYTYLGPIHEVHPLYSWVYPRMGKSRLLRLLGLNFPRWAAHHALRVTETIIQESAKEFRRLYPDGHFYVVRYLGGSVSEPLLQRLRASGIECYDYSALPQDPDVQGDRWFIDTHPTALRNKEIARQLVQDLNIADEAIRGCP